MLNEWVGNLLDSWGFGSKDTSLKEKFFQHQNRHLELIASYQKLCQDSFGMMLTSTMRGDLKEMQKAHQAFLKGLNKTLESMFENNIELASQTPEKIAKVINFQREAYEKLLENFPSAQRIKGQINKHYLTKGLRKLAFGTMSAALVAVAVPTAGTASEHFPQDVTHAKSVYVVPQQVNQILDEPFIESQALTAYKNSSFLIKDLIPKHPDPRAGDSRYQGRSDIYDGYRPKMPMIHAYYHGPIFPWLGAALPGATGPSELEYYLSQNFPTYEKVYSFTVASLYDMGRNQLALKPQYLVHPDAPNTYQGKEFWSEVDWTVIPGVEGQITPRGGEFQKAGLLHETIITHPGEQKIGNPMNLSADVMHLNGIEKFDSSCIDCKKDLYSVVLFTDEVSGKKIAAITYHWLFANGPGTSFGSLFSQTMEKSKTMRELITNLESVNGFEDITGELKRYVGLSAVSPVYTIGDHLGKDVPFKLQGFSDAEGTHRWTQNNKATIKIPVLEDAYQDQLKSVIFKNTGAYVTENHPTQHLSVFLNDTKVADFQYNLNSPSQTIEIPIPASLTGEALITFDMPDAISPFALGLSDDKRTLGVSLTEMETSYRTKSIAATWHHLGQSEPYTLEGFSHAEGTHRWTKGNKASIQIPTVQGNQRVTSVSFNHTSAFVNADYDYQMLSVFLNGKKISDFSYNYYENDHMQNDRNIKVYIPSDLTGDAIITFEMPDAVSPQALGMSDDDRPLGIRFGEIETFLR